MHSQQHEFLSTEHLGTEAIVAFVDGELTRAASRRAKAHLLACSECRREVAKQRQASRRLRDSAEIHIPADLRARLANLSDMVPDEASPAEQDYLQSKPQSFGAVVEQLMRAVRKGGVS